MKLADSESANCWNCLAECESLPKAVFTVFVGLWLKLGLFQICCGKAKYILFKKDDIYIIGSVFVYWMTNRGFVQYRWSQTATSSPDLEVQAIPIKNIPATP